MTNVKEIIDAYLEEARDDGNMSRRLLGHLPDDKGEDLVSYLTAGDALWAAASVRPEVLDELADALTPQGEVVL